jgi:RHS repeat-associated protein
MRKLLVESSDAVGKVTFQYDAGGRLEKMIGATGAVTQNSYDELGNKVVVSDPDLGIWKYEYDPFGRVVRQMDAKGQNSTMEYDDAGRPKRRIFADVTTKWDYDSAKHGVGKIASVNSSNGYNEDYYYDQYGRLVSNVVLINHDQFITERDLDSLGRVTRVSYPSSLSIENFYDSNGYFAAVKDGTSGRFYWAAKNIDALGRVTEETFGNGVRTLKTFDPNDERLRSIQAKSADSKEVLDLALKYDLIGNLTSRVELAEGRKESFDYDQINRLVDQVSTEGERLQFRYDASGRLTYKSGVGDYHYGNSPAANDATYAVPFHGVQGTNYGKDAQHYKYDLNGNMVSAPAGHIDYTSDNHVRRLYLSQDKWSTFDYGPSGDRFRQVLQDGDATEETLYIGIYEKVIDSSIGSVLAPHPANPNGVGRFTRSRNYLVNATGLFAFVETDDTFSNAQISNLLGQPMSQWYGKLRTSETWYLHSDQLGSVLRVSDQNGHVRKRYWYDPWGARQEKGVGGPTGNESQTLGTSFKRGFTGHEHLDAFSLVHMNGRVYNPALGVFLSVDPLNQMTADSQQGNGYAYTRNNPLRYIDPSGMNFLEDVGNAIGGVATAVWHGVTHFGAEAAKWVSENWRVIVVVAVVIVVTYVTLGSGTSEAITLGDAILAGAAAGAAGSAVSTALYGGTLDEVIQSAIKGAIIGAISAAAFYGVGEIFDSTEEISAASKVESMAAHGVVGGAKEVAEGGDFWKGFISTAATKASSLYGPRFDGMAANTARAAMVGGTVAVLDGGKFANGAVTGAFSYAFNDALHPSANERATSHASGSERDPYSLDDAFSGRFQVNVGEVFGEGPKIYDVFGTPQLGVSGTCCGVGPGVGFDYVNGVFSPNVGLSAPFQLGSIGYGGSFSNGQVGMSGSVRVFSVEASQSASVNVPRLYQRVEQSIYRWMGVGQYAPQ